MHTIRRHLSCFTATLGNTKLFMDEMHIGNSCFGLVASAACQESGSCFPKRQLLLPSERVFFFICIHLIAAPIAC